MPHPALPAYADLPIPLAAGVFFHVIWDIYMIIILSRLGLPKACSPATS